MNAVKVASDFLCSQERCGTPAPFAYRLIRSRLADFHQTDGVEAYERLEAALVFLKDASTKGDDE